MSATDRVLFRRFGWGPARAVPREPLHRAFERCAAANPDAVAVEHEGARIGYGELDRQADRLAGRLIEAGVRPGDHVALFVRRGIPMITGLLAALKAGAAYVPQDARIAPPAQLAHIVATAEPRVVLTESGLPVAVPHGPAAIAIDTVMAAPLPRAVARPAVAVSADAVCFVLFTSGTTGRPNGVAVTHANVANLLFTEPGGLGIGPGTVVGQVLNIAFDMAAWEILGSLARGGTLRVRGAGIAETARQVDVLIATPTILSSLDPDECARPRVVAVAGEPCPRALADRWARARTFYNGCGPTETTIVNTMQRHDPAAARLTIGRPTPNNTVYVLDERRRPCRIGETGEMWAGGDGVSAGYLANPALNAERYAPDPFLGGGRLMFNTRDLGRWTPEGELEHLGRTDDQVKIRGFRVELDSVSAALETVPGCTRAATLKLDDRTLVSFVQPATVDPGVATQAVANALPYYCTPAAVYPIDTLPVTSRGKIDKAQLAALVTAEATAA